MQAKDGGYDLDGIEALRISGGGELQDGHFCAITLDTTLKCSGAFGPWGDSVGKVVDVNSISISDNSGSFCALTVDGTVDCWDTWSQYFGHQLAHFRNDYAGTCWPDGVGKPEVSQLPPSPFQEDPHDLDCEDYEYGYDWYY